MMKRERKNYAPSFEDNEAIQSTLTIEATFQDFLLAKEAQRSSQRTIRDYRTHFKYLKAWLDRNYPDIYSFYRYFN